MSNTNEGLVALLQTKELSEAKLKKLSGINQLRLKGVSVKYIKEENPGIREVVSGTISIPAEIQPAFIEFIEKWQSHEHMTVVEANRKLDAIEELLK